MIRLFAALPLLLSTSLALAASTSERLERLERTVQNQSRMLMQIEQLQNEMQTLRGMVEEQQNQMNKLRKQQRDLYLDLDQRINDKMVPVDPASLEIPASNQDPAESAPPAPKKKAAASAGAKKKPDPAGAQKAYDQGFDELNKGQYDSAITSFEQLLERYPDSKYAPNAQFWMAEAYYVNRDFNAAQAGFEKVVTDYPGSSKVPDAILKIAYIRYDHQAWTETRLLLEKLLREYPNTTAAMLAKKRLNRMEREGI